MIGAIVLALAMAALPQQDSGATAPGSTTVTVTGRRESQAKAIRHMTAAVTPVGDATRPLPRFAEPICPDVGGIPAAYAHRFTERMRADALAAGLKVDRDGCAPNITVLFVPNGQEVVRALHKTRPGFFGTLEPFQIRRLAADAGPIHTWSFSELRSRDDDRPRTGTTVAGKDAPELQVRDASIIVSPTRIVVDGSILLIDQPASVGKTINQLADYAVMRTLAQARPVGGGAAAEATILRLFDHDEPTPAPGLTTFDAAYLKALYRGQPTQLPLTKVGMMARDIARTVAATAAADDKAPANPAKP